jgi:flagellar motor switch protein FliG
MIQDLPSRELDSLLRKTIEELLPGLEQAALPRIAVAQKVSELLSDTSVRARGLLQTSLAKHGSLLATVNQKRVTFEDVLALEDETLAELLDEVDAEQIAALALGLAEPAQAKVARVLSRKVQMAVRAEMQRLQARQATLRRAQGQSLEIQAALVERVKGLVEEGVVDLKRGPTSPSSGPSGRLPPGKESA